MTRARPMRQRPSNSQVVRAVFGSVALAVLVLGIPAALVGLAGLPLPRNLPTVDRIRHVLGGPDDGQVFLAALTVAGWFGWAALAVSALVEVPAGLRGVAAVRLPALGWSQRLAGLLVGAVLAGFPAGIAAAVPRGAAAPVASPVVAADPTTPVAVAGHREYLVRSDDSLWRIAERELGDPIRYREIAALNAGRVMGDGRRFDPDRFIYPGWILYLPGHTQPGPASHSAAHVVVAGETLSEIAAVELGDADRYPQIFQLNEDRPQPDGRTLTDPDLIRPGWRLLLPPTAAHQSTPAVAPHPSQSEPPRPVDHPARSTVPGPQPDPRTSPTRDRRDDQPEAAPATPFVDLGGVLAAGVVAALGFRRVIQQHRRRPGQRIAMPRDSENIELALRAEQDPAGVALLDRALGHMASRLAADDRPPPALTAARIGADAVDILLAEPAEPVPPFRAVSDLIWRVDPVLLNAGDGSLAPYPALVTLGRDEAGALWLVDLRQTGPIAVTGEDLNVRDVLTAFALELATSPWSAGLTVVCVGFGADLPAVLGPDRVRHATCVDDVAADPRDELPTVVLSAQPGGERLLGPGVLGLVAAAAEHSQTGRVLDAIPGSRVDLGLLPVQVAPQRVIAEQYRQILIALSAATGAVGVPADNEPPADGSRIPTDEPAPDSDPTAPEIRVLGPVEVAGRDVSQIEPGKRNLIPELAAYLKLNPGRGPEAVSRAMGGPRMPWSASTRASNMSRLRAWLGRDPTGRHYLPAQGEGPRYTLLDSVGCDWHRFEERSRRGLAPDTTGTAELQAALDLVRGQPFSGGGSTGYIWAEYAKQEMISAITDVAHALAVRLMRTGKPAAARAAIARGLDVEPGSELLYRDLFRAEHQAGNIAGIADAARRLDAINAELGVDMEPDTAELLAQLLPGLRTPERAHG